MSETLVITEQPKYKLTVVDGKTLTLVYTAANVTTGSAGISDGDKGDIVVTNNGLSWAIDNGVIGTENLGEDITAAGKALLDDVDSAAQRATLGLTIGTNVQAYDSDLQALANVSTTGFLVRTGSGTVSTRTISANNPLTITNGNGVSGAPVIGIATGDRGDITVSNSGATWTIDNNAVTYAKIQDVSATDRLLGRSTAGPGDIEEIPCTAAGRQLLDDVDATAQRTTLGLGTMATQAADNVAITGGSVTGLTDLSATAAEVTGTLTADHIHGNLAGSLYSHVRAGENLAKGDPVYISGFQSGENLPIVMKARADDPAKMPAVGVMDAALTQSLTGHMVVTGQVTNFNTDAYAINDTLYVGQTGGLTRTPPTNYLVQPVGRVERKNQNNGAFIVKVNGLAATNDNIYTLAFRDSNGKCNFQQVGVVYNNNEATILAQEITDNRGFQLPDADGIFVLTDQTDGTLTAGYINSESATSGQVLTADGFGGASFLGVTSLQYQDFTSGVGTIAQPANAKAVSFQMIGGGGGGGSGRRGAAGSERSGGGGGGAAGVVYTPLILVSEITWPIAYTVGVGGAGAAAVVTDDTNGSNGAAGGDTSVVLSPSATITAKGGNAGRAGNNTANPLNGGNQGFENGTMMLGNVLNSTAGASGTSFNGATGINSGNMISGSGGGGGGGLSISNSPGIGSNGGAIGPSFVYRINGGAAGTATTAATAGQIGFFGVGTGGGGGSATDGLRNGANGARGGGGGGGGASTNGQVSGAGGNGGNGFIRMYIYE